MDTLTYMENRDRLLQNLVDFLDSNDTWSLLIKCRKRLGQVDDLTDYEKQLIKDGHMILAIASIRHRTLLGLRESKDLCDAYRSSMQYRAYAEVASAQATEPVED